MKRIINILIIIVIYLVFSGKSCVDDSERIDRQKQQVRLEKDSIMKVLATESLTEEDLISEEVIAMQKLMDLADYMEIYTDRSLDSSFRNKAGDMILEMFNSQNNRLFFGPERKVKMKQVTLKEFLEKGFGDEFDRVKIDIDSVKVIAPLILSEGKGYSGKLSARLSFIGYSSADSLVQPVRPWNIDFYSTRRVKSFGRDTLAVRAVCLGDFYPD